MERQALNSGLPGFAVRFAAEDDLPLILDFIRRLAVYEKLEDQVVATEDSLRETLFRQKHAEVLIGLWQGRPVAFALFFHNYSTFLGRPGLYLEDLFVDENARGKGFGGAMFRCLAQVAVARGCGRMDWWCLDWNESAIGFYKRLGAQAMDGWTVYRLNADALQNLAGS